MYIYICIEREMCFWSAPEGPEALRPRQHLLLSYNCYMSVVVMVVMVMCLFIIIMFLLSLFGSGRGTLQGTRTLQGTARMLSIQSCSIAFL